MSELFDIYQQNISSIFKKINKNIDNLNISKTEKVEFELSEADKNIKEADKILKAMELYVLSHPENNEIVTGFKTVLTQFKKKLIKLKDENESKSKLNSLTNNNSDAKQEMLIDAADKQMAWNQFHKLEGAKRSVVEMESISLDVMKDLHSQTEQIRNVNHKVNLLNGELITSNSLISKMLRRENRNKLIIVFFTVVLSIALVFIIFTRLSGSGRTEIIITKESNANLK